MLVNLGPFLKDAPLLSKLEDILRKEGYTFELGLSSGSAGPTVSFLGAKRDPTLGGSHFRGSPIGDVVALSNLFINHGINAYAKVDEDNLVIRLIERPAGYVLPKKAEPERKAPRNASF